MNTKVKTNIKNIMVEKKINYTKLSAMTKINKYKLIYILNFPLYRIKLIKAIAICKALNIKVQELF